MQRSDGGWGEDGNLISQDLKIIQKKVHPPKLPGQLWALFQPDSWIQRS